MQRLITLLLICLCTGAFAQVVPAVQDTVKPSNAGASYTPTVSDAMQGGVLTRYMRRGTSNLQDMMITSKGAKMVYTPLSSASIFGDFQNLYATYVSVFGDSLTAGYLLPAGDDYVTAIKNTTGYQTYNGGVPGETSTQILARFNADPAKKAWGNIFWWGRNNFTSPSTVKANIASAVTSLGHNRYIVMGVVNTNTPNEWNTGVYYHLIKDSINAVLATTYGDRYIDIRKVLVDNYNPAIAQDVIDHNHDVIPSSLTVDGLHLTKAGYAIVANEVLKKVNLLTGLSSSKYITQTTIAKAISGTPAANSILWNDNAYTNTASNTIQNFMLGFNADNSWHPVTPTAVATWLNLLDGSNFYVNNSKLWNFQQYINTTSSTIDNFILGFKTSDNSWHPSTPAALATFLGTALNSTKWNTYDLDITGRYNSGMDYIFARTTGTNQGRLIDGPGVRIFAGAQSKTLLNYSVGANTPVAAGDSVGLAVAKLQGQMNDKMDLSTPQTNNAQKTHTVQQIFNSGWKTVNTSSIIQNGSIYFFSSATGFGVSLATSSTIGSDKTIVIPDRNGTMALVNDWGYDLRAVGSGTGAATTISIAHGLSGVTSASICTVTPTTSAASGTFYVTTDATNINVIYSVAPVTGTNNLGYNIHIKP